MQGSREDAKQRKRIRKVYANISHRLWRNNRTMKKPEHIIRAEGKKLCREDY